MRQNIKFVHYLRAIGAISVIYSHWGIMFLSGADDCSQLGLFENFSRDYIPFFIKITTLDKFNFGMFGVALFFLISGFLTQISWNNRTISQFILKRVLRLYPLYAVGLLFTGGVLCLSAKLNGIQFSYTYDIFLKNLSLLRMWFWVPSIDGVNWTMEVDVFFYMICIACVFLGFKLNDTRIYMVLSFMGSLFIYLTHDISLDWISTRFYLYKFWYCVNHFFSFLPIIFIGCTLWNSMSENWSRKKTFRYVVLLYLLFCFDYGILNPNLCIPYRISYGFAIVIFMLAYYKRKSIEKISCKTLEYIADISFPIYIVHGAAGYAVLAFLFRHGLGMWSFLIAGIMFLCVAHFLHRFVEMKIEIFAKRLLCKIE